MMKSRWVLIGVVMSIMLLLADASACEFLCNCDHEATVKDVVSGCHPQKETRQPTRSDTHTDCDCCSLICNTDDANVVLDRPVSLASASQNSSLYGLISAETLEIQAPKMESSTHILQLPSDNRGSPAYILHSSLLF